MWVRVPPSAPHPHSYCREQRDDASGTPILLLHLAGWRPCGGSGTPSPRSQNHPTTPTRFPALEVSAKGSAFPIPGAGASEAGLPGGLQLPARRTCDRVAAHGARARGSGRRIPQPRMRGRPHGNRNILTHAPRTHPAIPAAGNRDGPRRCCRLPLSIYVAGYVAGSSEPTWSYFPWGVGFPFTVLALANALCRRLG